jgi:anti-anti-sigma factor
MSGLAIEIVPNSHFTIARLIGAADVSGSPELDRKLLALTAQRPKLLILDLSGLTFISSLAMGSLINAAHSLTRHGGKVAVAAAQPLVAEALRRIRLESMLPMYQTIEAASTALATDGTPA